MVGSDHGDHMSFTPATLTSIVCASRGGRKANGQPMGECAATSTGDLVPVQSHFGADPFGDGLVFLVAHQPIPQPIGNSGFSVSEATSGRLAATAAMLRGNSNGSRPVGATAPVSAAMSAVSSAP